MIGRVILDIVVPSTPDRRFSPKGARGYVSEVLVEAVADPHADLRVHASLSRARRLVDQRALLARGNDLYGGAVLPVDLGRHSLVVRAWEDSYSRTLDGISKKSMAGVLERVDLLIALSILRARVDAVTSGRLVDLGPLAKLRPRELRDAASRISALSALLEASSDDDDGAVLQLLEAPVLRSIGSLPVSMDAVTTTDEVELWVERERAVYSSWYEIFPRSVGGFAGVQKLLPHLCSLGFDVLYLPPIHPIGLTARKGRNNVLVAAPGDVGSPWAIGSPLGGHDAIDPSLGDMEDLEELVGAANEVGMEIALDLALQCSVDHPWVTEHPEWFTLRPDGTIATAENPPKRYEDIVPINFYPDDDRARVALWDAVAEIVDLWISKGVRIFRVDNPHTKPLEFWYWLIERVRRTDPDVLFLAEAFTRPRVMYKLAELGFSQSYTYFTWRDTPQALRSYIEELREPELASYFRPNLWPNTPDILAGVLRDGGQGAFALRLLLAATLSPSYGIYSGFEFLEARPASASNEEYLDSEKYQIVVRPYDRGGQLDPLIRSVNRVRGDHPAMRGHGTLRFLEATNPSLLAYLLLDDRSGDAVLCVVNFDPTYPQEGTVYIPPDLLGGAAVARVELDDVLFGERFVWSTGQNYVRLDPARAPGHLAVVTRVE